MKLKEYRDRKKNVQYMGKFLEMKPDVKMMERENIGNM